MREKAKNDFIRYRIQFNYFNSRSQAWMHSFEVISDPRSRGSWYIKGVDESVTRVDLSARLMHHDLSDLRSLILFEITTKESTLISLVLRCHLFIRILHEFLRKGLPLRGRQLRHTYFRMQRL